MPLRTFNAFDSFSEALGKKVHDLAADALKVMFTNVAPGSTNTVFADLTEITAENGYPAGGTTTTGNAFAQTAGVAKLTSGDVTVTASGGTIGPFRYAVLYNDTATNDELIGWWDYGEAVTLIDGEGFLVDFDGTTGILTVGGA